MDYEIASDAGINNKVKEILILNHASETDFDRFFLDALKRSNADYCNNPSVAWPIIELIFSKGVTLMINDTGVTTSNLGKKYNGKSLDVNCKPLRAAMIVFLMMSEG